MATLLAFFLMPGWPEMAIVGLIVLLLFGNRLPGLMRSLGRGIVEFKKGAAGIDDDSASGSEPVGK
jgi:sec-independent protein translocase protein TatA